MNVVYGILSYFGMGQSGIAYVVTTLEEAVENALVGCAIRILPVGGFTEDAIIIAARQKFNAAALEAWGKQEQRNAEKGMPFQCAGCIERHRSDYCLLHQKTDDAGNQVYYLDWDLIQHAECPYRLHFSDWAELKPREE